MAMTPYLTGSVGIGGDNLPGDVSVVRYLLNRHIRLGIFKGQAEIDDDCELLEMEGDPTIDLIMEVQKIVKETPVNGRCRHRGKVINWMGRAPVGPAKTKDQIEQIMDYTSHALTAGPPTDVPDKLWKEGLGALRKHAKNKKLTKPHLITFVDFRKGIRQERLWTVNLAIAQKLFRTRVAHGRGPQKGETDKHKPKFSNGNDRSSVGSYITRSVFVSDLGRKKNGEGYSVGPAMGVVGLNKTNSRASSRGIRFHSGWYMEGRVGRSRGCFVTDWDTNRYLCNIIADGSFVHAICKNEDRVAYGG